MVTVRHARGFLPLASVLFFVVTVVLDADKRLWRDGVCYGRVILAVKHPVTQSAIRIGACRPAIESAVIC